VFQLPAGGVSAGGRRRLELADPDARVGRGLLHPVAQVDQRIAGPVKVHASHFLLLGSCSGSVRSSKFEVRSSKSEVRVSRFVFRVHSLGWRSRFVFLVRLLRFVFSGFVPNPESRTPNRT